MSYVILTDSGCDLSADYLEKAGLKPIGLMITQDHQDYVEDSWKSIAFKSFYDSMRAGTLPTTSQITPPRYLDYFREHLDKGLDILYISFSSMLSGTYGSAIIAKGMLEEEYPDRKISIIDSKCASVGQGLLVDIALKLQAEGYSIAELTAWLEANKTRVNHIITVDDLNHLKRGGRLSSFSAAMGTMLSIKPIINMDNEGKLVNIDKVKGRKTSINTMFRYFEQCVVNPEGQDIFITHGDCEEEAHQLRKKIEDSYAVGSITLHPLGMAIGSHAGPNTLGLVFLGKDRETHS